jgi:hypothetical protein
MKNFFYTRCLQRSIIQFLDIFNDIQIAKFDENNIREMIKVPIKYMPKQKFYTFAYDRKYEKRFPMIGVELTDISYDEARVTGKYAKIFVSSSGGTSDYMLNGVPYNLSFSVNATTNYMSEMDQITEQILPFFKPNIVSRVSLEGVDLSWDMDVLFEGATIDQDVNIDMSELRKIHWTFTFIAKTMFFVPVDTYKNILKVTNKYFLSDESWDKRNTSTDTISGGGPQSFEGLTIGWIEDNEIMTRYERF